MGGCGKAVYDAAVTLPAILILFLGQAADPHQAAFNTALGVACEHCHETPARMDRAQRMVRMRDGLSRGTLQPLGGVTCWTCHRGKAKPARVPRSSWMDIVQKWPGPAMDEATLAKPAKEVFRNLQVLDGDSPASLIRMSMSIYSASLGVACDHCHVPGKWDADDKPAKQTARTMLRMFGELPGFFVKDASPTFQCFTCHQGAAKPQRSPA